MNLEALRVKHPCLTYHAHRVQVSAQSLEICFDFELSPGIRFAPSLSLPLPEEFDPNILPELEIFIAQLGMIELLSYWRAACPKNIIIKPFSLTLDQQRWWLNLYQHGLGEFLYLNSLRWNDDLAPLFDFRGPNLLMPEAAATDGSLVLVGGGKDSALSLELLRQHPGRKCAFTLNPLASMQRSIEAAREYPVLCARRRICPQLLQLNKQGYLNGHTPFSAYLAFLSCFVAELHSLRYVIASNEFSAAEASRVVAGVEVNHQYSKSPEFERLFREYCHKYLSPNVEYFSLLRPLHDLQICQRLAHYPEQLRAIVSCNQMQANDRWCTRCSKCAFTFLCLYPFVDSNLLVQVFGNNAFLQAESQAQILSLCGIQGDKPLDCVGTQEECRHALVLSLQRAELSSRPEAVFLRNAALAGGLIESSDEHRTLLAACQRAQSFLNKPLEPSCIPAEFANVLNQSAT